MFIFKKNLVLARLYHDSIIGQFMENLNEQATTCLLEQCK